MNSKGYSLVVAAVVVVVLAVYLFAGTAGKATLPAQANPEPASATTPEPAQVVPEPTTSDTVVAQPSRGFQVLVSYTDRGFEPSDTKVAKGDTIRFTNNSSGNMWIAASGTRLYPAATGSCGSRAFDTCKALKAGEYWEFTFNVAGGWTYQDNLHKEAQGVVKVK